MLEPLVDLMCCLTSHMWPLDMAIDLGRCLRTRLDVSPGHVVKRLVLMALIHVEGTGLNEYLWR